MIPVVVSVEPRDGYRVGLTFDDGTEGEVDIAAMVPFVGVFEPLRDLAEFRRVCVDAESGTIAWPGGADLDPLVLYSKVQGVNVEELFGAVSPTRE